MPDGGPADIPYRQSNIFGLPHIEVMAVLRASATGASRLKVVFAP
jgi:hypothetical protein